MPRCTARRVAMFLPPGGAAVGSLRRPLTASVARQNGITGITFTLASQKPRIALITSIGVTNREGSYNRSTEAHDWKRRSERLVRASGLPYTIVRALVG